jgi:hypothetical protein
VTSAPGVTVERPVRPGIGEVTGRVVEVDARGLHRGARLRDIRLGLPQRGLGQVEILLADGARADQRAVAVDRDRGGGGRGLVALERRLGAVQGRLIGRRIDLVELLARLDLGALGEEPLADHAADLRADLGGAEGRGPARQFRGDGHGLLAEGHHGDRRGRWRRRGSLSTGFVAACHEEAPGEGSKGRDVQASVETTGHDDAFRNGNYLVSIRVLVSFRPVKRHVAMQQIRPTASSGPRVSGVAAAPRPARCPHRRCG